MSECPIGPFKRSCPTANLLADDPDPHANETNLGSLGIPSGPILFLANLPSVYILLASSKPTLLFFMIFCTSPFAC